MLNCSSLLSILLPHAPPQFPSGSSCLRLFTRLFCQSKLLLPTHSRSLSSYDHVYQYLSPIFLFILPNLSSTRRPRKSSSVHHQRASHTTRISLLPSASPMTLLLTTPIADIASRASSPSMPRAFLPTAHPDLALSELSLANMVIGPWCSEL